MYVDKLVEQRLESLTKQRQVLATNIRADEQHLVEMKQNLDVINQEIEELEKHLNEDF